MSPQQADGHRLFFRCKAIQSLNVVSPCSPSISYVLSAGVTLRRWRHLLAAPLNWVGLSATLGDAARFFAELTGVPLERVVEVTPRQEEYEELARNSRRIAATVEAAE